MTMVAIRKIASGQQIYNDFGQLPRSDLLRRYGYVTDNYKRWDVVEVEIETVARAAGKFNKLDNRVRTFCTYFPLCSSCLASGSCF